MEEGASVALGGTRAVGRRAADRRTRARDHRLRARSPISASWRSSTPRATPTRRFSRPSFRRASTRRQQAEEFLRGCIGAAFTVAKAEEKPAQRYPAPPFTTSTLQQEAGPQAGHERLADHVRGPAPLRAGSDYLHAYRLGEPFAAGAGPVQGGDHQALRREILPMAQLQDQNQRGAGGPRGHPPVVHRPPVKSRARPPRNGSTTLSGSAPSPRRWSAPKSTARRSSSTLEARRCSSWPRAR